MSRVQDDELVMSLMQLALSQPPDQRETYLRNACPDDQELLARVMDYVDWEDRMRGFLLQPLLPPVPAQPALVPGDVLDHRFRIVREVAQGGMGIVYEAFDEKLRKRIALKCAKAGFARRLFPEVRHASEISHPNVCRIFEIHTAATPHGEIDFINMEFLDGETLANRLAKGRIPVAEAASIAMQISRGLAEAHRHRVVHGDLKSNNIILTDAPDGGVRAVITDFGLALGLFTLATESSTFQVLTPPGSTESMSTRSGPDEIAGTPVYMAPELWKGVRPSAASDVYALGIILYELAAGHRPFTEEEQRQGLRRKLPPAHSKWDFIIARCLDPDPAKRFSDAGEVARALEPSRTGRWWLAAAAAAVLAAGVGTITYLRATAPTESIRLAFLPLEAGPETSDSAKAISQNVSRELSHLSGGKRARLSIVPQGSATHLLHAKLTRENGRLKLHAVLTDNRTHADNATEDFIYEPGEELRYAPFALAGLTTAALRLPPLPFPPVNAAATKDYLEGVAYMRQNSTIDKALPLLTRATQSDPSSPATWAALAEAQWFKFFITSNNDWLKGASESLRQAQRRNPDLAQVHRVDGLIHAKSGSYEVAEVEYQRAIDLNPSEGQNHWRLGQVFEHYKRYDQALGELQKAVQLEPNYYKMYMQLGAFYLNRGDLKRAAQQLEMCALLAPDEPEAHFGLGTTYSNQGEWNAAEREFRLATVPGGPASAYNNFANLLIKRGKDREAIPVLLSALQQFQYGARYRWWMNLGDAYRRTSQSEAALSAYRRGLEAADGEMTRDPSDGGVRSYFAYFSARIGDRKRAESEIAQALQLSDEKDTLEMAACVYEALGEPEKAWAILVALSDDSLGDAARLPNLADLWKEPRFKDLLMSHHIK